MKPSPYPIRADVPRFKRVVSLAGLVILVILCAWGLYGFPGVCR